MEKARRAYAVFETKALDEIVAQLLCRDIKKALPFGGAFFMGAMW